MACKAQEDPGPFFFNSKYSPGSLQETGNQQAKYYGKAEQALACKMQPGAAFLHDFRGGLKLQTKNWRHTKPIAGSASKERKAGGA